MMLGFFFYKRKDGDVHNGFIVTLFTITVANWAWEFIRAVFLKQASKYTTAVVFCFRCSILPDTSEKCFH